jgi:hypothetical protein
MDTSSHAAVELAKGWLETCSREHKDCIIPSETILPSRLLEVSDHRVKLHETKGEKGAYLALSHCWGKNPIIKTDRGNLEDRKRDIPWGSLSKTFQDAIIFTWMLGYKYLWVDSLVRKWSPLLLNQLNLLTRCYSASFKMTRKTGKLTLQNGPDI